MFQFNDSLKSRNNLIDELKIDPNTRPPIYEALLIRLLSGTLKFSNPHLQYDREVIQNINYLKFPCTQQKITLINLLDIAPYFSNSDFAQYLASNSNKSFFKEIAYDLVYAFYYKHKKSYITSFLYIYRATEHLSFAFPLLYASYSKDYQTSFGKLKNFFDDNKNSGSLNFNKIFFKSLFNTSDALIPYNLSVTLNFSHLDSTVYNGIKKTFGIVAQDAKIPPSDMSIDDGAQSIEYRFQYTHDLIITFRNKFFHNLTDWTNNISSETFVAESFFESFNELAVSWIGYLYREILEKRL